MSRTKFVAFREEQEIIQLIDEVVKNKGIDRSDFIREAIRRRLAVRPNEDFLELVELKRKTLKD